MRSLPITVLLSLLIVAGKVKAQEHECIDSGESLTENKWQTYGQVRYDKTLEAFVLRDSPRLYKEAGDFIVQDPKNSIYLYIQYETEVFLIPTDEPQFIVFPNKDKVEESLELKGTIGVYTIKIVELSKEAVAEVGVRIEARKLGMFNSIHLKRIGIWYGVENPEDIQFVIEDTCGWLPPTTLTTVPSIPTTATPTTPSLEPSNSSSSSSSSSSSTPSTTTTKKPTDPLTSTESAGTGTSESTDERVDDDGFGITEIVLVTVLPFLAVAIGCTAYFYRRRKQRDELIHPLFTKY